jgi:hypothetical protein
MLSRSLDLPRIAQPPPQGAARAARRAVPSADVSRLRARRRTEAGRGAARIRATDRAGKGAIGLVADGLSGACRARRYSPPTPPWRSTRRIFGKPADRAEAEAILAALSGKRHEVLTAVALKHEERVDTALCVSEVQFRELSAAEIRDYVATGECDDKAGAYGIQGRAATFVQEIRGSSLGHHGPAALRNRALLAALGPLDDRRNPD